MRGVDAIEEEKPEGAGDAEEQTSNPNGSGRNAVVEKSAKERSQRAGNTPTQPMQGHVASAQVGGGDIGDKFAGGGDEGEFAEGDDDHAEPETPETAHERDGAGAESVDRHTRREHGQCRTAACDVDDGILQEDAHEGVGGGDPAVERLIDVVVCFSVNRHEDPHEGGGDEAHADDEHEGDETFVLKNARVTCDDVLGFCFRWCCFFLADECFFHEDEQDDAVKQVAGRCSNEGVVVGFGGEEAANGWTEREGCVVGDAVDGVGIRAFFGGDHVCEHRIRADLIERIRQPCQDHEREELRVRPSEDEQQVGETVQCEADVHNHLAPDLVCQGPGDKGSDQPRPRVDGDQRGYGAERQA